jgi:hypothetical protein
VEDSSAFQPKGADKYTPTTFFDNWMLDIDTAPDLAAAATQAHAEREKLRIEEEEAELQASRNKYSRPSNWSGRLFSHFLGALPKKAQIIQPTNENLSKVGDYYFVAALTMVGAVGSLITLSATFPLLSLSPHQLVFNYLRDAVGDIAGNILSTVVMFVALMLLAPRYAFSYTGKFWDRSAMAEEQWFRMGAENWSASQRITSCISFGFFHIVNWFYPVSSLIVLCLVGVVFMIVYLQEYKRSNNTTLATLASTKMHSTFNRFAVVYFLAAIAISYAPIFFD